MSKAYPIKVTIMGCGTSVGVPSIGCDCEVCTSDNEKNKRNRASILIETADGKNIIIDTPPEFRLQVTREKVTHVEAVFYTHMHADHVHGFDDLRAYYWWSKKPVPCYLAPHYVKELKERFRYAFEDTGYQGVAPQVVLNPLQKKPFKLLGLNVETVELPHGSETTTGFRFGNFAYITDFKEFPKSTLEKWKGKIDVMVASAIRFGTHPTHSGFEETAQLFKDMGVKRGIITHIAHNIEYIRDSKLLPAGVELAFDGMKIDVPR